MSRAISEESIQDSRYKTITSEERTRHPTTNKKKIDSPARFLRSEEKADGVGRGRKGNPFKMRAQSLRQSLYVCWDVGICWSIARWGRSRTRSTGRPVGPNRKSKEPNHCWHKLNSIDWRRIKSLRINLSNLPIFTSYSSSKKPGIGTSNTPRNSKNAVSRVSSKTEKGSSTQRVQNS